MQTPAGSNPTPLRITPPLNAPRPGLNPGDPLALTLAADARLGPTDYANDQIWEVTLGGGEPPALGVQTTFGLRARAFRIFPRFSEGERSASDPADFVLAPQVERLYPNFARLRWTPLPLLEVVWEVWVAQSNGLVGRVCVSSTADRARQIRMDWAALLVPDDGQRMAGAEFQAAPVLVGRTGGLQPLLFLTGGPQVVTAPYPALSLTFDLPPRGEKTQVWACVAAVSADDAFSLARSLAARPLAAEFARLDLLNAGQVEVLTGDRDWNLAFELTQKAALGLFIGPTERLPEASFAAARQPDHGGSLRGDGSDYNHLWNGQSVLDAYALAAIVLPSAPNLAVGLLQNALSVQEASGFIDWKPGLAGQRSRMLATPILASFLWLVYTATEDLALLREAFPKVLAHVRLWFGPAHDRDGDGIPEWDHPLQGGLDENPLYARWRLWAQGAEIQTAESPSLASFLYRECRLLARLAPLVGEEAVVPELEARAASLRLAVEAAWDGEAASYFDWDRDTHFTSRGEWIGRRTGPGALVLGRNFPHAARLLIKIQTTGETTRRPLLFVHGKSASGRPRIEQLSEERFRWFGGVGTLTGERVYSQVAKVEIQQVDAEDVIDVYTVDYHSRDWSVLLPLWAGIPAQERAAELIEQTVLDPARYWRPFGVPNVAELPPNLSEAEALTLQAVNPQTNSLIVAGLVQYGYRREAAELVGRLMRAVIQNLKREGAFRQTYHAQTGLGQGERSGLTGLAPLAGFLEVLGVRLISSTRVVVTGVNPFPWPVTIKYRGLTVLNQAEKTDVIFPDGQSVTVTGAAPQLVTLAALPEASPEPQIEAGESDDE